MQRASEKGAAAKRARANKRSCEDCFFHRHMLCALGLDKPCPTFRPYHPDGLRPPQQLQFAFRHPRVIDTEPGYGSSDFVSPVRAPDFAFASSAPEPDLEPRSLAAGAGDWSAGSVAY
jgi:hypothetical protein